MAKQKFTVAFNVPEELKLRTDNLFPNGKTADVLTKLLDTYEDCENKKTELENLKTNFENQKNELENLKINLENDGKSAKIIQDILDLYEVNGENELLDVCADYKRKFLAICAENRDLSMENERLKIGKSELEKWKTADLWDIVKQRMAPFTAALLETTAARLSERENHEIEPMQILTNMFLRYTIEQWSQWFYPFVLSDREIVAIAHENSPEITTMSQLKQLLHHGK